MEVSTLAVAVARAGSMPISPVYQVTVSAGVPSTNAIAVSNGGPATRCGGWPASTLKKSPAAATAEAAVSDVAASLPTAAVSAVSRLPGVRSLVARMANWFGPGLADVVAVSVMLSVEPSGRVKRYSMVSPSVGLPAVRSTVVPAGGPDGVTVALVRFDVTPAGWSPEGDTTPS